MNVPGLVQYARPRLPSLYRMQFEVSQGCWVLLYPEGMVQLNSSAAEILRRCDGHINAEQLIAAPVRGFTHPDLGNDVRHFLNDAHARGWFA